MAGLLDRAMEWIANHAWKGYGSSVSLDNYTSSSNQYAVPSDGVVRFECNYRPSSYCIIYIDDTIMAESTANGQNGTNLAGNMINTVPVFKGQKVYIARGNQYCHANFYPYKNMGGGSA